MKSCEVRTNIGIRSVKHYEVCVAKLNVYLREIEDLVIRKINVYYYFAKETIAFPIVKQ